MELWSKLYLLIWLAFLEFLLVYVDIPGLEIQTPIHIVIGFVIIVLTIINLRGLKAVTSPDRLVRITSTTAGLAVVMAILGMSLSLELGLAMESGVRFVHLVMALAIITQASSVATAYDMWEEKEFENVPAPA